MAILDTCTAGISCSSLFSYLITTFTNDVTGNLFLTLFAVFIVLYVLALVAGLPNELALLVMLPYTFVCALITENWFIFIGAIGFYVSFLIAKNLW